MAHLPSLVRIGLVVLSLSGCSLLELKDQIKISADIQVAVLKTASDDLASPIVADLYWLAPTGMELVERRVSSQALPIMLAIRNSAEHGVFLFQDRNRDGRWQADEAAAIVNPTWTGIVLREDSDLSRTLTEYPVTSVTMNRDPREQEQRARIANALAGQHGSRPRPFLETVAFSDARFSPDAVTMGAWQPLSFIKTHGYGLYTLAPWDKTKIPVLFVHGINDSPRVFETLVGALDRSRFQPVLFYYPSSMALEYTAAELAQNISQLCTQSGRLQMPVVAHSMGGLVSRRSLQLLDAEKCPLTVPWFLSIASPFGGSDGASKGVEMSPIVAPVWRDMASGSGFQQQLAVPLKRVVPHHMIISYGDASAMISGSNDGAVTVESQLAPYVYKAAASVKLENASHVGVVSLPSTIDTLKTLLGQITAQP